MNKLKLKDNCHVEVTLSVGFTCRNGYIIYKLDYQKIKPERKIVYDNILLSVVANWQSLFFTQYIYRLEKDKKFLAAIEVMRQWPEIGFNVLKADDNNLISKQLKECSSLFTYSQNSHDWIKIISWYGSTSLPNIFFCLDHKIYNWEPLIKNWNQLFQNWYWLQSELSELSPIIEKVHLVGWTSDSVLFFMLRESEKPIIESCFKIINDKYGYVINHINEHNILSG